MVFHGRKNLAISRLIPAAKKTIFLATLQMPDSKAFRSPTHRQAKADHD